MSHRANAGVDCRGSYHRERLEGEAALATLSAFREMGVEIIDPQSGRLTIEGVVRGLKPPAQVMDVGTRHQHPVMAGLLAGRPSAALYR